MIRKTVILAIILLLPGISASPLDNCITSQCHTDFKKMQPLHFPAKDSCLRCHETKVEIKLHKFTLADQTEVCFECHDENRKKKYIHDAITEFDCAACHNPHGGQNKAYLKTQRIDSLCFECHDKSPMTKKVKHTPLRSGECTACHRAHSSDYPILLIVGKKDFCIHCHKDKDFSKKDVKVHSCLPDGCSGCHDPHSTDFPFQLSALPGDICGDCHEDFVTRTKTVKHPHPILTQDKKCLNCHDAHASKEDNNLKMAEADLCLDCHNTPLTYSLGRRSYNIKNVMKNNPLKHEPLKDGKCSECHKAHGSDFFRILAEYYPQGFYREFTVENYKLCFQCHDPALVTAKETNQTTNFRDGTRNLHYLHVDMKKGRTCRACHEVHASKLEKLIRRQTPFGKWDIPMNFKKTASGGSCSPGCHVHYEYDRSKKQPIK